MNNNRVLSINLIILFYKNRVQYNILCNAFNMYIIVAGYFRSGIKFVFK